MSEDASSVDLPRRRVLLFIVSSGFLALMLAAAPPPASAQGQQLPDLAVIEAQVERIFQRSCARSGCHAGPVPQQGLDLSPDHFVATTVGVRSEEKPELMRVHPGQPDSSYLMMKIRGDSEIEGFQMPLIGDKLTDDEIATVAEWISALGDADVARSRGASRPAFPFYGWKVINLPTSRTLDSESWLFLISHRFNPPVSDGYEAFYGLDGSGIIYLALGYAITDRLLVALGRSNASDNVELLARQQIARQGGLRSWPAAVAAQVGVNWITETARAETVFQRRAFKATAQLSLTRALGERGGIALVPGILINPDEGAEEESPLVTIGLGGRWRFYRGVSLVGEWVPIVAGYTLTSTYGNFNRFDSWGGGIEITTSGHVFQIVLANSVGLATDHYMRGGDLDVTKGDVRLGFNIFRILNF